MTTTHIDKLKSIVALLPDLPGVYRFIDASDKVIYVGKAKSLKKRVSSYLTATHNKSRKVQVLVKNSVNIEHIVVASETDALLLENNLIKSLKPRYNILLKDDKTYPWICIKNEPFPRIVSTRRFERDGSRYFGPYSSVYLQKQMLEMIRGIYPLRSCSLNLSTDNIRGGKFAVCLKYHIGNCKAPCVGYQSVEDYSTSINMVADILRGDVRMVMEYLAEHMAAAATALEFEKAEEYKKQIDLVRNFRSKTVIVNNTAMNLDVLCLIKDEGVAFCNFMRVRSGAVVNSFTIEMKFSLDESETEIMDFAVLQIDEKVEGGLSREVVVSHLPTEGIFEQKSFSIPQRGDKVKLLELSEKNVKMYRLEKLKYIEKTDPERHSDRLVNVMQRDLCLDVPPRHIECFDNSNLQGTNPVASCVVFRGGKPSKKEYRHFNIKTVIGANDFASMQEVVSRRYKRLLEEGAELPQLIVVDGGKGQLSFAYNTLKSLGLENQIAIIGLAKRLEEIFYPGDSTPMYLDKTSETLRVLMHIRDEAHRFGITFHRQKRSKNFIKSELDNIEGVGKTSVMRLMKKFGTLSKIKTASKQELAEVVGEKRATAVVDYLNRPTRM